MSDYPDRKCLVEIVFLDGSIETFQISAGASIAQYLTNEVGKTGILTLLNGAVTKAYPVANIRSWSLTEIG